MERWTNVLCKYDFMKSSCTEKEAETRIVERRLGKKFAIEYDYI